MFLFFGSIYICLLPCASFFCYIFIFFPLRCCCYFSVTVFLSHGIDGFKAIIVVFVEPDCFVLKPFLMTKNNREKFLLMDIIIAIVVVCHTVKNGSITHICMQWSYVLSNTFFTSIICFFFCIIHMYNHFSFSFFRLTIFDPNLLFCKVDRQHIETNSRNEDWILKCGRKT